MKAIIFYTIFFQNLKFDVNNACELRYSFHNVQNYDSTKENDFAVFRFDSLARMCVEEFHENTNLIKINYIYSHDTIINETWEFNGQVLFNYAFAYYKAGDTSVIIRSDSLRENSFPIKNGVIYRTSKKCKKGIVGSFSGNWGRDIIEQKRNWCGNSTDSLIHKYSGYVKYYMDCYNENSYTLETNSPKIYDKCIYNDKFLMDKTQDKKILKMTLLNYQLIFSYKNGNIYKIDGTNKLTQEHLFNAILESK